MTFAITDTQQMLAEMLERLLDAENEFEARRQRLAAATPARMALWPKFSEQGILGAGFAEEAGGFGGSIRDIAVVMEQAGRKLVVEPILSTTVCGRILQRAGYIEAVRSEEHTSELQSLMRISYAVFCLK